jgi:hypothetical protein
MPDELDDLTIVLSEHEIAHIFTLSPYEYNYKYETAEGGLECLSVVVEEGLHHLKLGWPFLRNFIPC